MSEPSGYGAGQGSDAEAAVHGAQGSPGSGTDQDAAQEQVVSEGERMARKLVQDVAAYEVDPPPPARAEPASGPAPRE